MPQGWENLRVAGLRRHHKAKDSEKTQRDGVQRLQGEEGMHTFWVFCVSTLVLG
jgi:hypothetical protein